MKRQYGNLFSPYYLGKAKVRVRNRIETSPTLSPMIDGNGYPAEGFRSYYVEKAKGGAGIVTIGETAIDWEYGKTHNAQINLWGDYAAIQLANVVDGIHKYGALANIELCHGGVWSAPELIGGKEPIGPSETTRNDGVHVREMTKEQMEQIKENYVQAVLFCKLCGFDMVMLHGAHGWLLGAFLSPVYNHRTDEYGGSRENRERFPLEVLQAIREAVGDSILIEYRISGDELCEGGTNVDDCISFLKKAQQYIDLAHISVGTRADIHGRAICQPSCFLPHGVNSHYAKAVKASGLDIPVLAVGAMDDPELADAMIGRGEIDFVAIARGIIADPYLPKKAMLGQTDDIVPCIRCMHCLDRSVGRTNTDRLLRFSTSSHRFTCSVNPTVTKESEVVPPATVSKNVVIVGGGPGGMEAALKLRERGHKATILEKSDHLGGALCFSDYVDFKIQLKEYKDYLIHQVEKQGIPVQFGVDATPELVESMQPDAVIVAVGADAIVPPIPGIEKAIPATDSYSKELTGRKLVIIGGGQVGCETALHFAYQGKDVTIVEMQDIIAKDASFTHRIPLLERLDESTTYLTGTTCVEITDEGIVVKGKDGALQTLQADHVILAAGMKAKNAFAESFGNCAPEFFVIGDCVKAATVHEAVTDAYRAAIQL